MRRLNNNSKYVRIRSYRPIFVWTACSICGVDFLWEHGYEILTDRCLQFPSDEDRERKVVRKYTHMIHQYLCLDCGAPLLSKCPDPRSLVTHEEFDLLVDEYHNTIKSPEPKIGKRQSRLADLIPFTGRPSQ